MTTILSFIVIAFALLATLVTGQGVTYAVGGYGSKVSRWMHRILPRMLYRIQEPLRSRSLPRPVHPELA